VKKKRCTYLHKTACHEIINSCKLGELLICCIACTSHVYQAAAVNITVRSYGYGKGRAKYKREKILNTKEIPLNINLQP
jgi:hypothetical protein